MARPTKLTKEVQEKVVQAIRGGNFRAVAADWAGIGQRTFKEWMRRGATAKRGPHVEFRHAVLEAEKAAEMRCVALVMKAATEDAKHAEWWLERKFPGRWGRKAPQTIELTGKTGSVPIQFQTGLEGMSAAQLVQIAQAAQEVLNGIPAQPADAPQDEPGASPAPDEHGQPGVVAPQPGSATGPDGAAVPVPVPPVP